MRSPVWARERIAGFNVKLLLSETIASTQYLGSALIQSIARIKTNDPGVRHMQIADCENTSATVGLGYLSPMYFLCFFDIFEHDG